jgi:mannan endo-1,4-beta-mannosidase
MTKKTTKTTRPRILAQFLSCFALLALSASLVCASEFVTVKDHRFERDDKSYRFMGTNLWCGMNLGSEGPGGDRERLVRELDRLQKIGVKNLRILAATEGPASEPWRIAPALQNAPGVYDVQLLEGLDFLLDEMSKRDMTAVVVLGDFWDWSGGFGQYLAWSGAGPIPYPPPQPGGSWDEYMKYSAQFYSNSKAVGMYLNLVKTIVTRTNSISGVSYSNDPTIMAWELANEPRGMGNVDDFNRWIENSSRVWI